MPGNILHLGATVFCSHFGQATPTATVARVLVSGQPIVTAPTSYLIAGCTLPPPTAGNGPCVTGQFTTPATRVFALGMPVLVNTSPSLCVPTGTPLVPSAVQTRVIAM